MTSEGSDNYLRRKYGSFYWLPSLLGVLIILYAISCFVGYRATHKFSILILALFSVSLGLSLVTIGVRSRVVAVVNATLATIICVLVIIQGEWPLMFAVISCLALTAIALIPRNRLSSRIPTD
jgi:hypothetical protein